MPGVGFRPLRDPANIVNTVEGMLFIIFEFFSGS